MTWLRFFLPGVFLLSAFGMFGSPSREEDPQRHQIRDHASPASRRLPRQYAGGEGAPSLSPGQVIPAESVRRRLSCFLKTVEPGFELFHWPER